MLLGEPVARADAWIDGDGGVSMIVVVVDAGASAIGPTLRRATFGGGLKIDKIDNDKIRKLIFECSCWHLTLVEFCVEFLHFVWVMHFYRHSSPQLLFGYRLSILVAAEWALVHLVLV